MMSVAQLFPKLIGIVQFEDNMDFINSELEKVQFRKNTNKEYNEGWSEDTHILNQAVFAEFKQKLTDCANNYFENVLCYCPSDLQITQSWVNIKQPGEHHWPHKHPNSIISGSYYWQDDIVPLVFTDDTESNFYIEHNLEKLYSVEAAQKIINVQAQKNTLILFESTVMHGVGPNNTDKDRYSLAFNMFPSKLGNKELLSELDLTKFASEQK